LPMRSGWEMKWKMRSNGCAGMSDGNTSAISNGDRALQSALASVFDPLVSKFVPSLAERHLLHIFHDRNSLHERSLFLGTILFLLLARNALFSIA
jgi:hypothetical protein